MRIPTAETLCCGFGVVVVACSEQRQAQLVHYVVPAASFARFATLCSDTATRDRDLCDPRRGRSEGLLFLTRRSANKAAIRPEIEGGSAMRRGGHHRFRLRIRNPAQMTAVMQSHHRSRPSEIPDGPSYYHAVRYALDILYSSGAGRAGLCPSEVGWRTFMEFH